MFDKKSIRRTALALIAADGHRVGTRLAQAAGLSRQVANGHLQALLKDGLIDAVGTTKARVYSLKTLVDLERVFPREGLDEDRAWRDLVAPVVADLAQAPRDTWHYAATEMINNAVDHSGGTEVRVRVRRNALFTEVTITDDGEGIFLKIQRALGLHDAREALLELAKGKLTTAPKNHSGEGIFFTSRVVDVFEIASGSLHFTRAARDADRLVERTADAPGTVVFMRHGNDSTRTMKSVFDQFSDPEEYAFDRTVVPIRLAQHEGEKLVSRSQAKRVAYRFERFRHVVLDFSGVEEIGQAFADELFRVFAANHPQIRLIPENTSPEVGRMISRAVSAATRTD
jgi:anti-sigma regulatory factor (Ser/Thr protein kinase)